MPESIGGSRGCLELVAVSGRETRNGGVGRRNRESRILFFYFCCPPFLLLVLGLGFYPYVSGDGDPPGERTDTREFVGGPCVDYDERGRTGRNQAVLAVS